MSVLKMVRAGLSFAWPAWQAIRSEIAGSVLVHRTRVQYLSKVIEGAADDPTGFANCKVRMTGDFGASSLDLLYYTLRDHRIVDLEPFQGAGDSRFFDFVYFFLGEPADWQVRSQNFGGDGQVATIRVRGVDVLADPARRLFYRKGDRVVIVKGGYAGPAQVDSVSLPGSPATSPEPGRPGGNG